MQIWVWAGYLISHFQHLPLYFMSSISCIACSVVHNVLYIKVLSATTVEFYTTQSPVSK